MHSDTIYKHAGLVAGFARSCARFPDRPALLVNGAYVTYDQLYGYAKRIAHGIDSLEQQGGKLAGFLGYRSLGAYSSILGILMSGRGYVPLNPNFPLERTEKLINITGIKVLIVCEECFSMLPELVKVLPETIALFYLDISNTLKPMARTPRGRALYFSEIPDTGIPAPLPAVDEQDIAYLLFTSGSTGIPKGVPICHGNIRAYIDYTCYRYGFTEFDRFSQTADMTFDLCILEIFPCWESGSCLYCIPKSSVMLPAKFIRDHELTVWISVPSVGVFLDRVRLLRPGAFPSLRYCLFDGEPLLATIAGKWQVAAENAIIENLYGPTEATVAITDYRWEGDASLSQCANGIVPIGRIFKGQFGCVVDENLRPVPQGHKGELCLAGTQVSKGYFNDPDKTKYHFVKINGDDKIWYRTGDVVIENKEGCLQYICRTDFQVKILGYRVELQEIDHVLRKASGQDLAMCVAWPRNGANAEGVVGFVPKASTKTAAGILDECKNTLPAYMVPDRLVFIESIPINSNGKTDRMELSSLLERGCAS